MLNCIQVTTNSDASATPLFTEAHMEDSGGSGEHGCPALTLHAYRRAARRNVGAPAVEYVLAYGRMVQRTGITFYFLGRRDIPQGDLRKSWVRRLEGTVALVAPDGEIVTVYRNRRALSTIRRKAKHRSPDPAARCA